MLFMSFLDGIVGLDWVRIVILTSPKTFHALGWAACPLLRGGTNNPRLYFIGFTAHGLQPLDPDARSSCEEQNCVNQTLITKWI